MVISMFKAIHYFELMYLRTFEICVRKYMSFILQSFFFYLDWDGKQLRQE